LRLLLLNIPGPTGFKFLKNGKETFVDAAKKAGLIEDPLMWIQTVQEAFGQIWNMRGRYRWLAQLLATSEIPRIYEVVAEIALAKEATLLPRNMETQPDQLKLNYVLTRLDLILRAMSTSCQAIGLPKQNQHLQEFQIINVINFSTFITSINIYLLGNV
jgi:hypothetical protein